MKAVYVAVMAAAGIVMAGQAQADEALAKAKNCMSCHAIDKKLVGPAYKEVAAKYKGDKAAPAMLAAIAGPLLLAFGAACLHRYPFMAHYGGNRLMLFSAPFLYLIVALGGWAVFAWLWHRRQRWLALVLTVAFLVALNPRAGVQEDLYPLNNREEIQPLVTHLEANLKPRDLVYVYYFAVAPFKYYYRGPATVVCWGQSCVEKGLDTTEADGTSPQRLWLIASHIPDLNFLRQFAANLLGPDWREAACFTRVGAVLLRFDRQTQPVAAKTPTGPSTPPESGAPDQSTGTAYKSIPGRLHP